MSHWKLRECDVGTAYQYHCNGCGNNFPYNVGGGFRFDMVACSECGEQKYLKQLEDDVPMPDPFEDFEAYQEAINERSKSPCPCGGTFAYHSPIRCRKCRSTDVTRMKKLYMYD